LIKQNHVVHLLLLLSLAPFLHIKPQQIRTRKNTTPAMSLTPNHQYQNSLTKSSLFFSYAITPTKENHSRLKTLNNKKKGACDLLYLLLLLATPGFCWL
jgi:hypothetical protein